jgi:diphthamide biosynthesis protein 2
MPRAWLGEANDALTLLLLTLPLTADGAAPLSCAQYSPRARQLSASAPSSAAAARLLGRRYAATERARGARCVGLVAATLGCAAVVDSLRQLRQLCASSGRRSYTLLVGKPSAAKLGNFPECDVFVLLGCAAGALLDGRDFPSPVLTPHEAWLALGGAPWLPGAYRTGLVPPPPTLPGGPMPAEEVAAAPGSALALRGADALAGRGAADVTCAADFMMHRRTYRGMPPLAPAGGDVDTAARAGLAGRAAAYATEGQPACCTQEAETVELHGQPDSRSL